ncbi:murein L,D-transpeptidase catalytic domain family protein [Hymenobacter endophyticus]|uniref:Murein L,D-transpeptidase catalytic domain family protein n=1 Tax=Hymenobacter endophyticus TaxID=3076335 RepID=A0ABU3TDJ5_9BACT|nr:murein L,D-transpeptidase catalytic domain family protein [Hymenobacter endophyticus]MDU0369345.1 murein L,D-transpeptidase catalytic domain family protein [Hymenobacter endophyticus]
MTFTAPFYRPLLRRCLGYVLLVGMLAGCQSSATELPAARLVASAAPTTADSATAIMPSLSDSLRLTPLEPLAAVPASLHQAVQALHTALGPEAATLRLEVLERACVGYLNLRKFGKISQPGILAVADMDLPSSEKRLWVLDLRKAEVLQNSHVAHGRGSGHLRARRFSNVMKSACTALGFYRTQDTYQGKHGLSRRLRGLDAGQNDNALRRYVVLHAADYVSQQHLQRHGQAGYSRGCPALPPDQYRAIIRTVGEGGCLYLSGPGLESKWLNPEVAAQQLAARGWR